MTFVTCDLLDDNAEQSIGVIPPMIDGKYWRQFGGKNRFFGQVVTVKCFEDNSRIKELFATEGRARVLVVDGGASLRCALLGDMIAQSGVDHGWAGIIISGCVRDVDELVKMPLGVMALAATPQKSVRKGVGDVGLDINIGGIVVRDGAWLYADNNGILVSDEPLMT